MADNGQDDLFFGDADPVGDDGMLDLDAQFEDDEVFDLVHHGVRRERRRSMTEAAMGIAMREPRMLWDRRNPLVDFNRAEFKLHHR